jgi:hypothetical protein
MAATPPPSTGRVMSMEEFRGDAEQFDRLREALRALHAEKKAKSVQLARHVKMEAGSLGTAFMTRQDIDKFREGEVERPRELRKVLPLWNVVFSGKYLLPATPAPKISDDKAAAPAGHEFFYSAVRFFDVHQHRNKRLKVDLHGKFVFYHYSEYFHKFSEAMPKAVVVGQWDIALDDGVCSVEEKQDYDGKLGKRAMRDLYKGYGLPKGPNMCFILKEGKKETPKFYMLEAVHDDPETFQTQFLAGYMLKGSYHHKFFHSPVYAVRAADGEKIQCNILRCGDIPADVLHELERLSNR